MAETRTLARASRTTLALFYFVWFASGVVVAHAAPEPFLTWRVENYAPSEFSGKIFPSQGAMVTVGLAALENSSVVDFSKDMIRWYLNNIRVGEGRGLTRITYAAAGTRNGRDTVRVEVTEGRPLETSILIPVVSPKLILQISDTAPKFVRAVPFFFNVNNLNELVFTWNLSVSTRPSNEVNVRYLNDDTKRLTGHVIAQHVRRVTEFARTFIPLP